MSRIIIVLFLIMVLLPTFLFSQTSLEKPRKFIKVTSTKPFAPNIGYLDIIPVNERGVRYSDDYCSLFQIEVTQNNVVVAKRRGLKILNSGIYSLKFRKNSRDNNNVTIIDSLYILKDTLVELFITVPPSCARLIDSKFEYNIKYQASPRRIIRSTVIDNDTKEIIRNAKVSSDNNDLVVTSNYKGEFTYKTPLYKDFFDFTITHDDYEDYYYQREGSLMRNENINISLNKKINIDNSNKKIVTLEYSISDGGLNYGRKRKTQISLYENNIIDSTLGYELKKIPFKVLQIISKDSVVIEFNDQGLYLRGENWNQRKTFSPLIVTTEEKCLGTMSVCSGTSYCFRIVIH